MKAEQERRAYRNIRKIMDKASPSFSSHYAVIHNTGGAGLPGDAVDYDALVGLCLTKEEYAGFLRTGVDKIVYLAEGELTIDKAIRELIAHGEYLPFLTLRIARIGPEPDRRTAFPWIRNIETAVFDNRKDALRWGVSLAERIRMGGTLRERFFGAFFTKDITYRGMLEGMESHHDGYAKDLFAMALFRDMMDSADLHESVMLGFDYMEFLLSSVHYYYKVRRGDRVEHEDRILSLLEHGSELLRLTKDDPDGETLHQMTFDISDSYDLLHCHRQIGRYFSLDIQGDTINFFGMLRILQEVRNHTRGHGVIAGRSGQALWELILLYLAVLELYLDLPRFHWKVEDGQVLCGYGQELLPMSPYLIVQSGVPCVLFEQHRGRREYINYFLGEYSIPEII